MEPVSTATLLLVLDLLGIAVFAASGALTAVQKQLDIFGVVFLAGATGLGGGIIRDVLVREIPAVLMREIYATAALVGTVVVVVADRSGAPATVSAVLAIAVTFVIRVVSRWRRWSAPVAAQRDD